MGRPRKHKHRLPICLTIDEDKIPEFKRMAEELNESLSQIVEDLLDIALEDHDEPPDH